MHIRPSKPYLTKMTSSRQVSDASLNLRTPATFNFSTPSTVDVIVLEILTITSI